MRISGREQADWGFELPTKGWYVLKFTNDIRKLDSENTGKSSLLMNTQIVGSDYDEVKIGIFAPWNKDFGRQKICDILVCTGLAPYFEKQFSDETDIFDSQVLKELKLKLPGRKVKVKISIRKHPTKDRDVVNIDKIEAVSKSDTTMKAKIETDEELAGF